MKKLLVLLVLVGLSLAGAAYWLNPSGRWPPPSDYTLLRVEYGPITESVSATGLVHPREAVVVGSELSGRVVEVKATFNDRVNKGDVLLKLDDRMALAKREQALVAVELAKADVDRAKAARDAARVARDKAKELLGGGGFKRDLDVAEAQLKAAEALVTVAEVKVKEADAARRMADLGVELTEVRAPASGTVIDCKVVAGQLIGPPVSAQLFILAKDLEHMQVHTQVAEGDISRVRKGLKAKFQASAYSDQNEEFLGQVVQIRLMPTSIQTAVFYNAVIDVLNRRDPATGDWQLRPGMPVAVDLLRRTHEPVLKMPTAALSFLLEDSYQTEAARAKLARWKARPDLDHWKSAWVLNADNRPWPIFVRIGGTNAAGEPGIQDSQFTEVLEWDPEEERPQPGALPEVIIAAPAGSKPGFFDRGNLRVF